MADSIRREHPEACAVLAGHPTRYLHPRSVFVARFLAADDIKLEVLKEGGKQRKL